MTAAEQNVAQDKLHRFLAAIPHSTKTVKQSDSTQKMLFALADDAAALLAVLTDKLNALRDAGSLDSEAQKRLGEETLEIWAPLANRLGMSSLKGELEDLGLKFTNPEAFLQIRKMVAHKKSEREALLERAKARIAQAAENAKVDVHLSGRAKHFYSIYLKMRKRNVQADQIFDLLAIRIIVPTMPECYTLVGIVHGLWKPVEGHFKDYIARPKPNGYRSLHTAVNLEGNALEIQIRTADMHQVAEHGVASHWLYKQQTTHTAAGDPEVAEQMKVLQSAPLDDNRLFAEIREKFLGKSIFVFTPQNDVIELPTGATAIDFAYAIHSAIGEKIVAAKADGRIIPLSEPLKTTQTVEILTNPQAHPTVNQLQFVKTPKARSKIRGWLLQSEAPPQPAHKAAVPVQPALLPVRPPAPVPPFPPAGPLQVIIGNNRNFLVTFARCCHPEYGDPIVGYVSRGRGVIVHRADCRNLMNNPNSAAQSIDARWDEGRTGSKGNAD
jgi:GTP pyrophosphokinase